MATKKSTGQAHLDTHRLHPNKQKFKLNEALFLILDHSVETSV
jgi:hypothetical protein